MKTFLRVLYTKILYRIPLKFLLIFLAVVAVFIASFSHADLIHHDWTFNTIVNSTQTSKTWAWDVSISSNTSVCFFVPNVNSFSCGLWLTSSSTSTYTITAGVSHCFSNTWNSAISVYYSCRSTTSSSRYLYTSVSNNLSSDFPTCPSQYTSSQCQSVYTLMPVSSCNSSYCTTNNLCPTCPECDECSIMSSAECQSNYWLIPVLSVDQNYCTTNNLCPSCPTCPSGSGGVSTLYINDILHVWSPLIYLNIPQELGWDYEYTQWGTEMTIDVEGYNVDYDAVQDIIDVQNYTPSAEEFEQVIWLLGPYTKIIILFVFIFIVWAWIKKPFKSKKL